jgi:hypothetical protein
LEERQQAQKGASFLDMELMVAVLIVMRRCWIYLKDVQKRGWVGRLLIQELERPLLTSGNVALVYYVVLVMDRSWTLMGVIVEIGTMVHNAQLNEIICKF